MNGLKRKFNNQKGASITWALLIFLVCTVVGSAVLVAGTAAAGRMSRLADSEQRYYAVTSTADLLQTVLKGPLKVTRNYNDNAGKTSYAIAYDPSDNSPLKPVVQELMQWKGDGKTAEDFWPMDTVNVSAEDTPIIITLTPDSSKPDEVKNAVAGVTLRLKKDGSILAVVSKDGYYMQLVFDLERKIKFEANTKEDTFGWVLREASKIETHD